MLTRKIGENGVWLVLLGLCFSLISMVEFEVIILRSCSGDCIDHHFLIVSGEALSPFRYRILIVPIAELLSRAIMLIGEGFIDKVDAVVFAYSMLHMVLLPLVYWSIYRYVVSFDLDNPRLYGIVAMMLFCCLWPMALISRYALVLSWAIAELVLFNLGLSWAREGRWKLVLITVVLACMNRTTGGLLAGSLLVVYYQKREFTYAIMLLAVSVIVIGLIRLIIGSAEMMSPPFLGVFRGWSKFGLDNIRFNLVFVPLWFFLISGLKHSSEFERRLMLPVGIYIFALLMLAQLNEVRLLFIVIFPLGIIPILRGMKQVVALE